MEGRDARPLPPPNPAMPYRDDCWSEGATSALIDAWGDRFVELNRGNLRQKDWQEVADAVNSRRGGARRPARTDSQCKNRIDTLKKKYKAEKGRIVDSNGTLASQWHFYSRLETLISASPATTTKKPPSTSASPPFALPLPSHRKISPLPSARPVEPSARAKRPAATIPTALPINDTLLRRNYSAAAAAAAAAAAMAEEDSVSSASSSREMSRSSSEMSKPRAAKRRRGVGEEDGEEDGILQLARAITRFAEIYEKVEVEKQRQMIELEKQRMEFAKEMEFQRMQVFVDSQVQIEKMKRARGLDSGDERISAVLPFLFQSTSMNMPSFDLS